MREATRVFDKMIAVGLAPTPRSYTILINGNCKINRIDEAMSLFKEMLQRSLSPDVVTYNTILQGFFRMGMCVTGREIFSKMQASALKHHFYSCCIVLNGL